MSLCDGAEELLKSYGIPLPTNYSETNSSTATADPVFSHWCYYNSVPPVAHYLVGTLLIVICALSITGNLLVIVIFSRYRRLRSPANTLIGNLAISDMLNGFLHPMAAYSSFKEHWMFGRIGCEIYAGLCGLFGLVSIVTLTAIAVERCLVISVKPWYGGIIFSQAKAKLSIVIIWAYCFAVILPPIFGWGSFVPEGFLTSCSFDYITRTPSNRSYFLYIFALGFFLPITVITVCYGFIIRTIFQNERDMKKNNVKKNNNKPKKRNDYKAAEMIMLVIAMFLFSWTPYSTIAIIGQFGNAALLTPWVSVLPSLFAKMSTIYNPVIYGLSHRRFRATLRRICRKDQRSSAERGGTYFSKNSTIAKTRNGCMCVPHYEGSDAIEEDSGSCIVGKKLYIGVSVTNAVETKRIIYVRKPQPVCGSSRCDTDAKINPGAVFRAENAYGQSRTTTRGRPAVLALQYEAAEMNLIRSLMFKSESSIHQKYQIFLEKDRIARIPSFICSYGSISQQKNESVNPALSGVQYHVPTQYIGILNVQPIENVLPNDTNNTDNLHDQRSG